MSNELQNIVAKWRETWGSPIYTGDEQRTYSRCADELEATLPAASGGVEAVAWQVVREKDGEILDLLTDAKVAAYYAECEEYERQPCTVEPLFATVALWKLLDDIDTLDDAVKSSDAEFRRRAYVIQRKRFDIISGEEFDSMTAALRPGAGA